MENSSHIKKEDSKFRFYKRGEPWVWLCGASLALVVFMMAMLLWILASNAVVAFWPQKVLFLQNGSEMVLGQEVKKKTDPIHGERIQLKVGNRDLYGFDFRWVKTAEFGEATYPLDALVVERMENGNFYGFAIEGYNQDKKGPLRVRSVDGRELTIEHHDIVRVFQPNNMSVFDKIVYYAKRIFELFTAQPRESNTEGGLFPSIFGTVMMVFLMSILSFPFGVVAGIYLREYAKEGTLVTLVRIAINNLAGIPSIVFGIFGLSFFIYGIGASIDQIFFAHRLPEPTFGTGGILWASLTLGVMTIPVVIVATEEALDAIPNAIRESSLALGATKLQTLIKTLLPLASPGIMTGFILSMSRAAGEVAPLMITGVVKLAPDLPLSLEWPFFHFDRKFMHLGFHIYDISSQSPNVEAAMPMIYVTAALLLVVVLGLNGSAILLRTKMRRKYKTGAL